jgi:hypothetical protein
MTPVIFLALYFFPILIKYLRDARYTHLTRSRPILHDTSINLNARRGMELTRNWPLTVRQQVRFGLNTWPVESDLKIKYSGRKDVDASQASESKTARRRNVAPRCWTGRAGVHSVNARFPSSDFIRPIHAKTLTSGLRLLSQASRPDETRLCSAQLRPNRTVARFSGAALLVYPFVFCLSFDFL